MTKISFKNTDGNDDAIQVAGLCHDLGHGPYSHLWENFIRAVNKGVLPWEHEQSSIDILEHIIESKLYTWMVHFEILTHFYIS